MAIDGPDSYQLGMPQWSPDGRHVLVSDTEGRLLVIPANGGEVRQVLPPGAGRSWVQAPLLAWHQGDTP